LIHDSFGWAFRGKPKLAAISVVIIVGGSEKPPNSAVFRYSAPWRRVAGILCPKTRANLSRANFAARNTFVETIRYNDFDPQLHPVVLPHVSHFMHVPLRTSVKLPHSEHISPS
jgi:hypothetical protein